MHVDQRRHLRVPQLADVEVALDAVRGVDLDPAEHDVARRLRQALALDDPLAAVRELAAAEERLQHRRLGLLELEEQRILVVAAEHEADPGARADAADADDLAGRVDVAEALEQLAPVARERAPVGADDAAEELLDQVRAARRATSSIGTISGGSPMMRSSPSTTSVSFPNALMLSLVRPLATFASRALDGLGVLRLHLPARPRRGARRRRAASTRGRGCSSPENRPDALPVRRGRPRG